MNVQQINSTGLQLWAVVVTALILVLIALIMWRVTERVRKALDVFEKSDYEVVHDQHCFHLDDMYKIDKLKTFLELIYFDGDWDRVERSCFYRLKHMARQEDDNVSM